jgi:hypothetical protein
MADGSARLSRDEILLLRALAEGRAVHLASTHRLRLELLGLINDGAAGITLTPRGRRCAQQPNADDEPTAAPVSAPPRDRLGRRKANRRLSPF